jgi:hypothetical protein
MQNFLAFLYGFAFEYLSHSGKIPSALIDYRDNLQEH